MYTMSQIRSRVNALKRKYALELQILRLHRIAEDFSLRWVRAAGDRQPLPETHPFIRLIADNGFRFHTFMNLHHYLEHCRQNGDTPDCWGIIRSLYANQDLDRISRMVEQCHALPQPDPAEDSDGLAGRPLGARNRHILYWIDRALRRYIAAAAAFLPVAHHTSRAWRRRQQRNSGTNTPWPLHPRHGPSWTTA